MVSGLTTAYTFNISFQVCQTKKKGVIASDLDLKERNEKIPSDTLENEKKEDFEKEEDKKVKESLTIEDELRQKDIESVNKEQRSSKDGKKLNCFI